jgi:hypothetical protein
MIGACLSHWRAAPSALLDPLQSSRAVVTRVIDDRVRLPCRRVAVHVDHGRIVWTICEAALCDRDAAMVIDGDRCSLWPRESIALRLCTHPPTHPPTHLATQLCTFELRGNAQETCGKRSPVGALGHLDTTDGCMHARSELCHPGRDVVCRRLQSPARPLLALPQKTRCHRITSTSFAPSVRATATLMPSLSAGTTSSFAALRVCRGCTSGLHAVIPNVSCATWPFSRSNASLSDVALLGTTTSLHAVGSTLRQQHPFYLSSCLDATWPHILAFLTDIAC